MSTGKAKRQRGGSPGGAGMPRPAGAGRDGARAGGSGGRVISSGRVTGRSPAARYAGSVGWWGPVLDGSGYGEEARGFLRGLERLGWPVAARSAGGDSPRFVELLAETPELAVALHTALNRPVSEPSVAVMHVAGLPFYTLPDAAVTVGRTMFETDGLPQGWAERLNRLDEIWVPSEFNVDTFRRAGVTTPLHVVPGGVDAQRFRPGLSPLAVPGARGLVFLSIFEWGDRKAPDILLRAWARAFGPGDDVCLVLRSYTYSQREGDSSAAINHLVESELAAAGVSRADVAPIVVLGKQLSDDAMPRLVASSDVYVGVARGEGWGRPLLEAMACGVTTIGTRWGGNLQFMDVNNSLLVDVPRLVDVPEPRRGDFFSGQRWAEPSVEHLAELMQRAAGDGQLRHRLGRQARSDVERRWQWHQVARVVEARLQELCAAAERSRTPGGAAGLARVRWRGDIYADHSLATVNRELVSRLTGAAEFAVEAVTTEVPPYPDEYRQVLAGVAGLESGRRPHGPLSVEVRHRWPPDFSPTEASRLVMIQPWEYGGIPADWIAPMRSRVDEVWVPTSWVRDCYVRSGIDPDRVAVVPNGVDVDTFGPDGPVLPLANRRAVRLLFVGGTIARKGFDLLLDTYLRTFTPADDVCLVVKPFGTDSVYRASAMDDRIRAAMADPSNPAIELVDRRLSREEMAALYRACQVLVHPYRGEGFGLPVAEAMACGLPTVVTRYGACLDFCDPTTSWMVEAREVPLQMTDLAPGPAGYWCAEPDGEHLRQILLSAVADAEGRLARGTAGRERIAGHFTWQKAARRARLRLAALVGAASPERRSA